MNLKNNETKELLIFVFILGIVIGIFSFIAFGLAGIRVFAGIIFISLPFYFIFDSFELNEAEKFVFSMLAGITLFSGLACLLGLIMPFRISILIVFLALLLAAFIIRKFRRKKNYNKNTE